MEIIKERFQEQQQYLPQTGKHIIGQFDSQSIIVYQAFKPSIAKYLLSNGSFRQDFNLNRMTWIKTSFLWMMYRSGWGTKPDQEVTLAIRIKMDNFINILQHATHSIFIPELYANEAEWQKLTRSANKIRLQWDPDRLPRGGRLSRKAIQLGLKGHFVRRYVSEWIVDVIDSV